MRIVEEWIGFVLEESERYQNLILNQKLNDAAGLGGAMGKLIRRGRGERPSGVLLTGPSGAGKHNVAWHILQALDEENFAPIFLSGEGLAEFGGDYPALAARLNALFDQFYDRGQSLCLVLEDPEASGLGRQLYAFLGMTLRAYQSYPAEDPALFLILIAAEQPPLPSMLRDELLFCPCALPNLARREAYLNERGKSIRYYVSLKRLAELSEGCSYAALGQLVDMLGFEIDSTDRAPDEETVLSCISYVRPAQKSDTPAPAAEVRAPAQAERENAVAEALHRLESVFADLAEKLTNLKLNTTVVQQTQQSVTDVLQKQEAAAPMEPDRKAIEDMKVRDLSTELFGQERLQVLLQN